MQGPGLRDVRDRSKSPEWKKRCKEKSSHPLLLPPPSQLEYLPLALCCQAGTIRRKAAHLRVVDTQGLDLVKGKQDTDEEHLVLFLKGQGEAVDDAGVTGGWLGPRGRVQVQCSNPPNLPQACVPPHPPHLPRISRSSAIPL